MTEAQYRFREFDVEPYEELTEDQLREDQLEELDWRRRDDGLHLALLWNKLEGTVEIHGVHEVTQAEFTFPVRPEDVSSALEEPIDFAIKAGIPTEGIYPQIREAA